MEAKHKGNMTSMSKTLKAAVSHHDHEVAELRRAR